MKRIKIQNFLATWEKRWGKLNQDWLDTFLRDSRITEILQFSDTSILKSVEEFRKLDDILTFLRSDMSKAVKEFSSNNIKEQRRTSSGVARNDNNSSKTQIAEWLRRFQSTKLDPESTFPRLLVKSTIEICESKKTYKSEAEAILALIDLESITGEMVLQIPYKCNICSSFHNTHLISRESLGKLLKKYKVK